MAAMLAQNSKNDCRRSASGRWKSSSAPTRPRASSYCHADGLWSEPLHGWEDAEGLQKTSRNPSPRLRPGSSSLISACSPGASQGIMFIELFSNPTLRFEKISYHIPHEV